CIALTRKRANAGVASRDSFRSIPLQKPGAAAARITARGGSACSPSIARSSASSVARSTALRVRGRLSVSVTTGPSRSSSTVSDSRIGRPLPAYPTPSHPTCPPPTVAHHTRGGRSEGTAVGRMSD
ncbi:MAG: hypothetical protein AVDCRST_MAG18-3564, partial [uncultured Thermomicrobiales bacterium]